MKSLTINVSIDVENPKHLKAACEFMHVLGGHTHASEPIGMVSSDNGVETFTPTQTEEAKNLAEQIEEKAEELAEAVKTEKAKKPKKKTAEKKAPTAKKADSSISLADLRGKVSDLIKSHPETRAEVKLKLEELGAASVSTLDPDKYAAFESFVDGKLLTLAA